CPRGYSGISKDRHSSHVGRNLFEKFEPFRGHAVLEQNKTRGIAAWPRQIIHEASADRIDSMCEHDRHGLGYSLQRRHSLAGRGQDYIRGERSQFSREFTIKRGFASRAADFNPHVLTFGPTQFLQSLPERHY